MRIPAYPTESLRVLSRLGAIALLMQAATLPALATNSESPLTASADIRLRHESKIGAGGMAANRDFIRSGFDNENDYFFLRTLLGLDWSVNANLRAFVQFQDARTSGDDRDPSPRDDDMDIFQLLLEWQATPSLKLTAGRQPIDIGTRILIGKGSNNNGRVIDAISANAEFGSSTWMFMAGHVVGMRGSDWNLSNNSPLISAIHGKFPGAMGKQTVEVTFATMNGKRTDAGGKRDLWAAGLRLKSAKAHAPWDWDAEYLIQGGKLGADAARRDLRASYLNGKVGYTLGDIAGKPRIGLDLTYSPGDSDPNDGRIETWQVWYSGGNHGRMGRMDLLPWRNIKAAGLQLALRPANSVHVSLAIYRAWLDTHQDFFYSATGGARSGNGYGRGIDHPTGLGTEINATVSWQLPKGFSLYLEGGTFLRGSYIDASLAAVGGARNAHFAQLNLNYKY